MRSETLYKIYDYFENKKFNEDDINKLKKKSEQKQERLIKLTDSFKENDIYEILNLIGDILFIRLGLFHIDNMNLDGEGILINDMKNVLINIFEHGEEESIILETLMEIKLEENKNKKEKKIYEKILPFNKINNKIKEMVKQYNIKYSHNDNRGR